ncbi:MAG: hypothetical protein HZB76_04105 [Chlamydiae bacterium]|nr:hypothetical protein [Chlamydiota bacterium]
MNIQQIVANGYNNMANLTVQAGKLLGKTFSNIGQGLSAGMVKISEFVINLFSHLRSYGYQICQSGYQMLSSVYQVSKGFVIANQHTIAIVSITVLLTLAVTRFFFGNKAPVAEDKTVKA